MKQTRVRGMLGVALAGTLVAAWFAPSAENEAVALAPRSQRAEHRGGTASAAMLSAPAGAVDRRGARIVEVLRIRRRDQGGGADEPRLFAVIEQTAPSDGAAAANRAEEETKPEAPVTPALPFRVLGRYEDGGQTAVFLQYHDSSLVAHVGDVIVDDYKVESLDDSRLLLRYLPLNQVQSLDLGGTETGIPGKQE